MQGFEMSGLGYLGADIVLDQERGPMMLELNARPGLAIQIANNCGLRKKLKKIEKECPPDLDIESRLNWVLKSHS